MTGLDEQTHRAPANQPRTVHEITARLFPAYTVEGGAIHLAGCRLDDRLFLKLEDPGKAHGDDLYLDDSGRAVEAEFARSLGMGRTAPWQPPPEMRPDCLKGMVRKATAAARSHWGIEGELNVVFVWCQFAEGKLRFTIGDRSADLAFSGWTSTLQAPPFVCPYSGSRTYHLAATDDGRICAAECIRVCAESGRRVLADELVTCEATGLEVLAELTRPCPVTGNPVLQRELVACTMCRQQVSPKAIKRGRCTACRSLRAAANDTPPLADLLQRFEGLRRWSKWMAAATAEVDILVATGWWKRLLLVVDKSDGSIRHAAEGNRLSAEYAPVAPDRFGVPSTG